MNANPMAAAPVPAGTFMAGTKVQVGGHRVVVEKYLSEGGFAHVYVVRLSKPVDGVETAVLKRVAVPDKASLANMRTEVETMKRLKGHKHIVTYIDSHASQLKGGGYEVFLLMEHCAGGGLIDFMNTRLQNRLTEPEILKIFGDVTEGVACMHYLKPPLLHRDLKVENILISGNGPSRCYKLCDFGSAAPPRPAATSAAEGRLIEDDVQRHTTLQYRSPEMIDVYRKQPIDEKSDIWALGVLLYKLCYYTTPFDEAGQMAILNAKFKYPAYPPFSDRLKLLIATMLKEHPKDRPNIYQVLRETCHMRGKEVPIRDIYSDRSHSESRRNQQLPSSTPVEAPKVGATFTPPIQETKIIPDIAPMRRGRPVKLTDQKATSKPSPSPLRTSGDPFAALDGAKRNTNTDELSSRFPTLDQFSLLHEKGGTFNFESANTDSAPNPDDFSKRVTNALADEAFSKPAASPQPSPTPRAHHTPNRIDSLADKKLASSPYLRTEPARQQVPVQQPVPQKPMMVSTGTMTSPSPANQRPDSPPLSQRPLHRFPSQSHKRQPSGSSRESSGHDQPRLQSGSLSTRPSFARFDSKPIQAEELPRSPASSRPSLEGTRPTASDLADPLTRSKSANSKSRPTAAYVASRLEYLRDKGRERSSGEDETLLCPSLTDHDLEYSQPSNMSDIDFLKAKEEEELSRKREKRLSSGSKHSKRGSLSSLSLSGTKTLLAGRFGEAFRRFENNAPHDRNQTPSPENDTQHLTPITGSEVTEMSDDGRGYDNADTDDISPEMRREMERRRLSMEERRVAEAAAQYRSQLNEREEGGSSRQVGLGIGSGGRAAAIQNKVQSLLKETEKPPPVKTASGYGRYTDAAPNPQANRFESSRPERPDSSTVQRYPSASVPSHTSDFPPQHSSKENDSSTVGLKYNTSQHQASSATSRSSQRPVAPPKPKSLRTGIQSANQTGNSEYNSPQHPRQTRQNTTQGNSTEDWELNFSRRYPSLSGLELVETEIDIPKASLGRTTATTTGKGL
ncbi:nak/nak-unclassified protein kinase [Nannizzia gypsea CBS 118893]|uniref:non-specific serine/threonine protein kinase n=1 Tax=Arthroderma gypseum (strain ATCC MYA-4604 / CBS 118893) TaxID=535722 RepID=E5R3S1_ARTGP|nr:nak/nak-unclassified protein kinase [Nannizzia gypsea CBS 118893]EFQ97981.1 nak/nak-unclassified protein kinase [Nannizzia gypsea CBS 118893]